MKVIKAVRDWFVTEVLGGGASHKKIWFTFNEFTADLEEYLESVGHEPEDYEEVPISEVMDFMARWFEAHPT